MEKIALLEKGIEFEEVDTRPSQEDDYLSMSPMGKVPCLETDHGCITEVDAILSPVRPKTNHDCIDSKHIVNDTVVSF